MQKFEIKKTQFRVTDFLAWQRNKTLNLNPPFQRRSVWKLDAKSFFIDTVVRGLPAPVIYIREKIDLDEQITIREVIDGQQRLRTLFAFIDHRLLKDFDPQRDLFTVKKFHNSEIAGKKFNELSKDFKESILSYEFSTHILPINIGDRDVLQMFARLNSTGVKLNNQELRNADYFGEFKTLIYNISSQQLDRWRKWKIFTNDDIARMKEVEMTSDIVLNMIKGIVSKNKSDLDNIYKEFDEEFDEKDEVERRFVKVMDSIDEVFGDEINRSIYIHEVFFFTLFIYFYDTMFGIRSPLKYKKAAQLSSARLKTNLKNASKNLKNEDVPPDVLDALHQKRSDKERRKIRLNYLSSICDA